MSMRTYKECWRQGFRRAGGLVATFQIFRHAYVYENHEVIASCSHHHRTDRAAMACADKMLRRELRLGFSCR